MSLKVIPANSESTKIKYKIPEYAKDFQKEWLYIRGINKKCGEILSKINFKDCNIFKSINVNDLMYHIKKFLKYQESGRLKDISCFYFKYFDVNNIECLKRKLSRYSYNSSSDQKLLLFDFLYKIMHNKIPNYKDFFELICLLNDKIKKEDPIIKLNKKKKKKRRSYY